MRITSIQGRMSLLFLAFVLLVSVSVGVTFWGANTQKTDARIINIAGRQRMLTQQMTWLALAQANPPDLEISIQNFDQNLSALREGGLALDPDGHQAALPPAPDPALRAQLDEVTQTWTAFQTLLDNLASLSPTDPNRADIEAALETEAPHILAQLDAIVVAFEMRAQAKVLRLQIIQAAFLVAALLGLAWGFRVIRSQIVSPIGTLNAAAQRMGEGNLTQPIPIEKNDELGELARAFESMRAELAGSRDLLEARVAQRTHELMAAFEISQEIAAQLDIEHLLASVVEHARDLMQSQTAVLCLLTPEGEYLELTAHSGEPALQIGDRQSVKQGVVTQVIGAGQMVRSEAGCANCAFLSAHTPGQCTAAPLRVGDQIIGALCVVRSSVEETISPISFDPDEERALTLLANAAAIAIANAHLVEAKRIQAEQAAILSERDRLAADLHDNLAQTLSFLNLKAERVEEMLATGRGDEAVDELERMKSVIGTAYGQVRTALTGLFEPPQTPGDFAQKLDECIAEFNESPGLSVELHITEPSALALDRATQTQCLHIIREALTNVRRHAQAKRARVQVESVDGWVHFTIEDDGRGFDPLADTSSNRLGLTIMRTRAERSGGSFSIDSALGKGTKIIARFPSPESTVSKDAAPQQETAEVY